MNKLNFLLQDDSNINSEKELGILYTFMNLKSETRGLLEAQKIKCLWFKYVLLWFCMSMYEVVFFLSDYISKSEDGESRRKSVKFSDGVMPGEGTSPSGGEELSSPPPAPKKLPKEKRYVKTKIPKRTKVPNKKKVKVNIFN